MSRLTIWWLCCVTATFGAYFGRDEAPIQVYIAFYMFLGAPLFMHYAFERFRYNEVDHD